MAIGWLDDLAEAETYFTTRLDVNGIWSGATDAVKTAALWTGYNRLSKSPSWTLPTTATQEMKDAQAEMAYFLIMDPDSDRRASLQAQGVTEAGIVKEKYGGARALFPPSVADLLDAFTTDAFGVGAATLTREG